MPARQDPPSLWARRARSGGLPPAGVPARGRAIAHQQRARIDVAGVRLRFAIAVLLAALAMLTAIAGLAAIS